MLNKNKLGYILLFCIFTFISIVLLLEYKMRTANHPVSEPVDTIIILGAKVRDTGPSLSLTSRMDAAILAAQHNSQAKIVLSGGQGADEPMSEAQAMFNYLSVRGIDKTRLILEDKSLNTLQNLTYSKAKVNSESRWLIVTNDYHAYRACMFAESLNMNAICHGAPAPSHVALKLRLREYVAIVYYWFLR